MTTPGAAPHDLGRRIHQMEQAVEQLSTRVAELTAALTTVTELDRAQQEINRQLPITLQAANEALAEKRILADRIDASRKRVEELAESVIPKTIQDRSAALRRFVRYWIILPSVVILLAVLIGMGFLLERNNQTINRLVRDERVSRMESYHSCLIRNSQVAEQTRSEAIVGPLLRDIIGSVPPSPAASRLKHDIDLLLLIQPPDTKTVDCSGILQKGDMSG